jgi:hypothetical protein
MTACRLPRRRPPPPLGSTARSEHGPQLRSHLGIIEFVSTRLCYDEDVLGRARIASACPKYLANQALQAITNRGLANAPAHGDAEARPARRTGAPDYDEGRRMRPHAVPLEGKKLRPATQSGSFRKRCGRSCSHLLIPAVSVEWRPRDADVPLRGAASARCGRRLSPFACEIRASACDERCWVERCASSRGSLHGLNVTTVGSRCQFCARRGLRSPT